MGKIQKNISFGLLTHSKIHSAKYTLCGCEGPQKSCTRWFEQPRDQDQSRVLRQHEHSYFWQEKIPFSARLRGGDKSSAKVSGTAVTAVYFSVRAGGCCRLSVGEESKGRRGERVLREGGGGRQEWGSLGGVGGGKLERRSSSVLYWSEAGSGGHSRELHSTVEK